MLPTTSMPPARRIGSNGGAWSAVRGCRTPRAKREGERELGAGCSTPTDAKVLKDVWHEEELRSERQEARTGRDCSAARLSTDFKQLWRHQTARLLDFFL